jgi:hypothetical protein
MTLVIVEAEAPAGSARAHAAAPTSSSLFTVLPPVPQLGDRLRRTLDHQHTFVNQCVSPLWGSTQTSRTSTVRPFSYRSD